MAGSLQNRQNDVCRPIHVSRDFSAEITVYEVELRTVQRSPVFYGESFSYVAY